MAPRRAQTRRASLRGGLDARRARDVGRAPSEARSNERTPGRAAQTKPPRAERRLSDAESSGLCRTSPGRACASQASLTRHVHRAGSGGDPCSGRDVRSTPGVPGSRRARARRARARRARARRARACAARDVRCPISGAGRQRRLAGSTCARALRCSRPDARPPSRAHAPRCSRGQSLTRSCAYATEDRPTANHPPGWRTAWPPLRAALNGPLPPRSGSAIGDARRGPGSPLRHPSGRFT